MNWTDQEIDSLLASVDETLKKAEVLAKSAPLKKDDAPGEPPKEDMPANAPPAAAAPAEGEQPPAEAAAPAEEAPAAPAEGEQPPAEGEQQLEGEEDQPLSDDELSQIYSSMPPEELERHYSIIRQALQSSYGEEQQPEAQPEAAAPAPAPEAPAAPAPEMEKSEKMATLEKQVEAQAAQIEMITKAFEALARPSRKSVTELQAMTKGEDMSARPMTKHEVTEKARQLAVGSLSKSESTLVKNFFLFGEGQNEVEKIINSKGGK